MSATTKSSCLPEHVAIIMDGNGRWAQERGLPRLEGHRVGAENIRPVIEIFAELHLKFLTLYAFSTENWSRPVEEVTGLLQILGEMIDQEIQHAQEKNIKFQHLGKFDGLPEELKEKIQRAMRLTRNNTGMTVSIAFNYGGRDEILEAVRRLISKNVSIDSINETLFSQHLYTAGLPDPDLIIRAGGEMRLSNFLIWQAAYAELYYTPVLWPDFGRAEIDKALATYSQRQRRFGSLKPGE